MKYEKFGLYVRNKNGVKELVRKSQKAVCGVTERELNVPAGKVVPTIKKLEKAGYHVIGTGYGKTPTKKIWFIRRGGL